MKKTFITGLLICMSALCLQSCLWLWPYPGHGHYPGPGPTPDPGPTPGPTDDRIENVVPDDVRDKMEDYMPIYNGVNPPAIEGVYLVKPLKLVYDSYGIGTPPDEDFTGMFMHFYNQNTTNNTLSYEMMEANELVESSNNVYISGSGNNFTVYFNSVGEALDITVKQAIVISGTKSDDGIKNLYYGNVVLSLSEPSQYLLPAGSYRIFKDGDGISENTSWPINVRSNGMQNSAWSKYISVQ